MTEGQYPNSETVSDEDLVMIAKSGDWGAFDVLLTRYVPLLKTRAMRYHGIAGFDADDFIQEGMLALFRAVKNFDEKAGAQFKTYAGVCVNNAMSSAVKKHLRLSPESGALIDIDDKELLSGHSRIPATAMAAEDIYIEREHSALLIKRIRVLLSDFERQVLGLYLGGRTYNQISVALSTTSKAVDNALQRVRRKLSPKS